MLIFDYIVSSFSKFVQESQDNEDEDKNVAVQARRGSGDHFVNLSNCLSHYSLVPFKPFIDVYKQSLFVNHVFFNSLGAFFDGSCRLC